MSGTSPDVAGDEPPHAACAFKVVVACAESGRSLAMATALLELIEPPADAVSRFEVPPAAPGQPSQGFRIEAYYQEAPDPAALARQLADLLDTPVPDLTLEAVAPENWVTISQAALPPVIAGRFTVHGSHDRHKVARGPHAILIDAGEAFGTAHHATTAGCLLAIDRLGRRHDRRRPLGRILDLGCGSGVLAIAAQRVAPGSRVLASDIDPIAVEVARDNARRNGATAIRFAVAAGMPRSRSSRPKRAARGTEKEDAPGRPKGAAPRRSEETARKMVGYDLLIANILAGPLIELAAQITRGVAPGGTLVLSGLLDTQARQVLGAYQSRGFHLADRHRIAGWTTMTLVKRGG